MSRLRTIRWRIALPFVALIIVSMGALGLYLAYSVRATHLADLQTHLAAEARLIADNAAPVLARGTSADAIDALTKRWATLLNERVTIISRDGVVLGDSHSDRTTMDNHLSRPEVQAALVTGNGRATRFSTTMQVAIAYVAAPIRDGDRILGVARVALPLAQAEASVDRLRRAILGTIVLTAILAVALALLIAERTTRPVRQLTGVAQRLTAGDLSARLLLTSEDEVGQLTHAFNQMADQLQSQITTLAAERGRLSALLDHMADGILITDEDGRVQLINPAAARLLNADAAAPGRSGAEVLRHHRLIELWQRCSDEAREEATETVDLGRQGLFLRVVVTPLPDQGGCLMVMQDLTQVRRLETVRRDFVSNISHELRTPLASLKALVDTLRDGALDDPPAAQHFLDRVEIEVDALTQMVQELLELSRIESGQVPLRLAPTPVADIILPAVERLRPQAERAGVEIGVDLPDGLPAALADGQRAQQVVTNLVHNAIKFTPAGGRVTLTAQPAGDEVIIAVSDTGIGIAAEDLPRIFERFYKADRARASGGTGLGLAIARHLVQAHGGRIWAESTEGVGSTFYFTLPV